MVDQNSISYYRKKSTIINESIYTAHHEAGHILYALLNHGKITHAYIFENKQTKRIDGFAGYEIALHENIKDTTLLAILIKNEIGICYAGLLAEKLLFASISGSSKMPRFMQDGSYDDYHYAAQLIRKLNISTAGKRRKKFKDSLIAEVSEHLTKYWEDLRIIAHALFDKKSLSYPDIKKIVLAKTPNSRFWKKQFQEIEFIFDKDKALSDKILKKILS